MSEKDEIGNRTEAFRGEVMAGLGLTLELLKDHWPNEVLPVDPYSMRFGGRTLEELEQEEKDVAEQVILAELGLDREKLKEAKVREYEDPDGRFRASVYKTNREIFLHELVFAGGERRWAIGADRDI